MSLACGCSFAPGSPVPVDQLRVHYIHTFESMMYWELLHRFNRAERDAENRISLARIEYLKALDEVFPEAQPQLSLDVAAGAGVPGVKT